MTRHTFNDIYYTHLKKKNVNLHNFFVCPEILLQKYGTNQCPLEYWLKHKCYIKGDFYQGILTTINL